MTLENEKRVFGTLYDPIKSIVIMCGRNALEAPMLGHVITTDEQLRLLLKIVSNNKHPWIKEHDLKVRSFENSIAQERVKKSLRKKRLEKIIKKSFWKRFSVKQKIKFVIKKSLQYLVLYIFAIGAMFLFFAIGFDGLQQGTYREQVCHVRTCSDSAQTGVMVKKSKVGLFGRKLFVSSDVTHAATMAQNLDDILIDIFLPEDCYITNSVLEAFVKVAIASDTLEELCVRIANAEVLAS